MAHLVRAVGCDLGLHDRLARDHGRQRSAGRAGVQNEDLSFRVIATEEQLVRGAQHSFRVVAGDLRVLDRRAVGHRGPGQRDGDQRPGNRVRRAGDDLQRLPTDVYLVHPQVVARCRVLDLLKDLADDDLREINEDQRLDLDPEPRQDVGGVLRRDAIEVDELSEPLVRDAHLLCDPHPDSPDYPGKRCDIGSLRPDYPGVSRSPMQDHHQNCSRKRRSDS